MSENDLIAYAITAWVLVQLARVFLAWLTARRRDLAKAKAAAS